MTDLVLLAAEHEAEGGFHAPTIADFFPAPFLFEGTLLEFNRLQLVRVIAAVGLVAILMFFASRAKLVPGRGQSIIEIFMDFVRINIAEEVLGKEYGRRYTPMLTTIFFAIVAFNITGVIPFLNIAGSSLIGLPIVLALWVYVMYISSGIKAQGVGGFLKSSLFPPGVPKVLYLLLAPIEFLQVFILRPATLAIRLMANMVAGHLMLVLTFSATHFFFFEATGATKVFGALTLFGGLAFTLFEILVALLQAYVFAILTAVYVNLSVEAEH